jgi:hypothetical protein
MPGSTPLVQGALRPAQKIRIAPPRRHFGGSSAWAIAAANPTCSPVTWPRCPSFSSGAYLKWKVHSRLIQSPRPHAACSAPCAAALRHNQRRDHTSIATKVMSW